jgi:hypothetical protein
MGLTIAVLVGSVRSDRQGIKAARFVEWYAEAFRDRRLKGVPY